MTLQSEGFYEFGPFRADPRSRILLREGQIIDLSPKVFDVLYVLLSRAGAVVTKETLLELVWRDTFVEEGNVAFNINRLRNALGDNAESPRYVETIRGRGYRFIAEVRFLNVGTESPSPSAIPEISDAVTIGQTSTQYERSKTFDQPLSSGPADHELAKETNDRTPLRTTTGIRQRIVTATNLRKLLVIVAVVALAFAVAESLRMVTSKKVSQQGKEALQEIALEVEGGRGNGEIISRSNASNHLSTLLRHGESRTLTFQINAEGIYDLRVRYSNDNFGPLETVSLTLDGEFIGNFIAMDSGDGGSGWNNFLTSNSLAPVKLSQGQHDLILAVSEGDGFGVEPDTVLLHFLSR